MYAFACGSPLARALGVMPDFLERESLEGAGDPRRVKTKWTYIRSTEYSLVCRLRGVCPELTKKCSGGAKLWDSPFGDASLHSVYARCPPLG